MRTAIVSPVGTPLENGAALIAILAGITAPDATNPWLLKIEPGIYDLGTSSLNMRAYVDIEGSGEGITSIRSVASAGTVIGKGPAELRQLTIENVGGADDSWALKAYFDCSEMTFQGVNFRASNGSRFTRAVSMGGSCAGAVFRDVTAVATGGGSTLGISFESAGASPLLERVHVVASGASGVNQGVYLPSGGTLSQTDVRVEGQSIEGLIVAGGSAYANGLRVEAIALSGGAAGVRVSTTGGTTSPQTTIENSSIVVSGPGYTVGLRNYLDAGNTIVRRSTISAGTGISMSGGTGTLTVDASTISGPTSTISLGAGHTARVGASQLSGGPVAGDVTCIGVYDEGYSSPGYTSCP